MLVSKNTKICITLNAKAKICVPLMQTLAPTVEYRSSIGNQREPSLQSNMDFTSSRTINNHIKSRIFSR